MEQLKSRNIQKLTALYFYAFKFIFNYIRLIKYLKFFIFEMFFKILNI